MRVGISIASNHAGLDDRSAVRVVIERARVAAAAGLDHLSLGDHHGMGGAGPYVQNVPMLGRLLAEWPTDRSAGLLFLLPLWHPVLAAEQIGTLAAMSDAPFIVQTGIGAGQSQFGSMGASLATRGKATDAAIAAIKLLLDGSTVQIPELAVTDASISPRPPVPVEWWIGSGMAPAAMERAARLGDAWYTAPTLGGAELDAGIADYRRRCSALGRPSRVIVRRDVLVGDDDTATVARAEALIAAGYRGFRFDQIVAGGVDRVTEQLAGLARSGVDDVVVRSLSVDQPSALRSIELMGSVRERLLPLGVDAEPTEG